MQVSHSILRKFEPGGSTQGTAVRVVACRDADVELRLVGNRIHRLHQNGVPWKRIAVLTRTRKEATSVLEALQKVTVGHIVGNLYTRVCSF